MTRQQEIMILRLWRDWCKVWPEQYGHESLDVAPTGYDPVFDVIPAQAYKDFYFEVVLDQPELRELNAFEVVDAALNQIRAPESSGVVRKVEAPALSTGDAAVAEGQLDPVDKPTAHAAGTA